MSKNRYRRVRKLVGVCQVCGKNRLAIEEAVLRINGEYLQCQVVQAHTREKDRGRGRVKTCRGGRNPPLLTHYIVVEDPVPIEERMWSDVLSPRAAAIIRALEEDSRRAAVELHDSVVLW